MKYQILKSLFIIKLAFVAYTTNALFGLEKVTNPLKGDDAPLDVAVQNYVVALLAFLYLAAVLYGLWGGFNIFTAAGDEDKVKKGKRIIIYSLLGVVIIFLAGPIIDFVINQILNA